jgi:hypothetical protein
MTVPALNGVLVRICDPGHPHYPEYGTLTGEVISVLGKPMVEMRITGCQHGTDGCFAEQHQIMLDRRRT